MNTVARRLLLLISTFLLVADPVGAQTSRSDPVDLHARYGIGATLNLPGKWESAFEYELRMVNNAAEYRGSYLSGELGYNAADWIQLFSGYRLASVTDGIFHRVSVGSQLSHRLGDTRLAFRSIVQYQKQNFSDDEQSTDEDFFLRARFRVKQPLGDRFTVYGSVEPYFTFSSDYPIDNWRNTAGVEFEFMNDRVLDVYYIYRPDYAKSYNRTFHVVGVKMDFDLDFP